MIVIGERNEAGLQRVERTDKGRQIPLGDIVKTNTGLWLAVPMHYRNQPRSWHKLRRDAVDALQ